MATPKRSWSSLSTRQQNRYLGAGKSGKLTGTPGATQAQVKRYYESGKNLERAQGHIKYARPDAAALDRLESGRATVKDVTALRNWQRESAPAWLRSDIFTEDTAAKLAGARLNPIYWRSVEFYYHRDGSSTVYIYSSRGGYTRKLELSDEETHELRQYLTYEPNQRGRTEVLVFGTDVTAPDDEDELPLPRAKRGTPVARRSRKKKARPARESLLEGIADLVSEGIEKAVEAFNASTQPLEEK